MKALAWVLLPEKLGICYQVVCSIDRRSLGSRTSNERIMAEVHHRVGDLPSITTGGRREGTRSAFRCAVDTRLPLAWQARVVGMAQGTISTGPDDLPVRSIRENTRQRTSPLGRVSPKSPSVTRVSRPQSSHSQLLHHRRLS